MTNVYTAVYASPGGRLSARGYARNGKPWIHADLGDASMIANGLDEIAVMERWADMLRASVAQAKQALADADLADVTVSEAVPA